MKVNIARIIEFVENVYGENNPALIESTLRDMGIDRQETAQSVKRMANPCGHNSLASKMVCTDCGEVVA